MFSEVSRLRDVFRLLAGEATLFVKLRLASVFPLILAAAILTALGPVALKLMVDGLTGQPHLRVTMPVLLVALYVLSQWFARAATEVRGLLYGRIERRLFRTLSERVFAHLMQLPLRFHLDRKTGAVGQTLDSGLEGLQMILHHLIFTVLPVTAEIGTVTAILWRFAPRPFLVLFCGALLLYGLAFGYSAATICVTARMASAARLAAGAEITDGLLNYEAVKYFTAESLVQDRVSKALARSETYWVDFYRRYARNGVLVSTIFAAFLAATTWLAAAYVRKGNMTVGDFVLINTYTLQLIRPVEMLGYAIQGFSQGLAMLDSMLSLFREAPEADTSRQLLRAAGPSTLEFDRVTLCYRRDAPVLTDVSFRIAPRHTLGIVGPSGSGKSTIVRLLMRLLDPDGGSILLDGIPILDLPLSQLRSAVAVVPQDTILFNDTLLYNIALGRAHATLAEVQYAARIARLHDYILTLPDKYDTVVGERGVKLSGGERQRVSIARAVLKAPRIFVFDEATSSLDSRTERDILVSLSEVSKCCSTLVIAHRLSTVLHADEIIVLDNGGAAERGTHSSLLQQNGRYAALWRTQQHGDVA